jgi:hypothetical protein
VPHRAGSGPVPPPTGPHVDQRRAAHWRPHARGGYRPAMRAVPLAATFAGLVLCSCASVEFQRTSSTSGTFRSSALAVTFLSWDMPQSAVDSAHENASDVGQPNTVPTSQWVFPQLGWFDWLLEIVSVRYAVVEGTWGYDDGELVTDEGALSSAGDDVDADAVE